jgi:hypothetical protein
MQGYNAADDFCEQQQRAMRLIDDIEPAID